MSRINTIGSALYDVKRPTPTIRARCARHGPAAVRVVRGEARGGEQLPFGFVHFTAMAYMDDQNDQFEISDFIDYAVISNPDSPSVSTR
jgi:hypothetical protein